MTHGAAAHQVESLSVQELSPVVAGHVKSNARQLPAEQMRQKQQVIAARGARFGSAAFVLRRTGPGS